MQVLISLLIYIVIFAIVAAAAPGNPCLSTLNPLALVLHFRKGRAESGPWLEVVADDDALASDNR